MLEYKIIDIVLDKLGYPTIKIKIENDLNYSGYIFCISELFLADENANFKVSIEDENSNEIFIEPSDDMIKVSENLIEQFLKDLIKI